jgi:hypothetical protein
MNPHSIVNRTPVMKDIELLVTLSDDLQSQGFIEPCKFLEIDGVAGGVLRSWRFKPRLTVCGVFSIPESWDDPASLIAFSVRAATSLRRDHRSRSLLGLIDCSLVIACNHVLFNRTRELLDSAGAIPLRNKSVVMVFDREGLSCSPSLKYPRSSSARHVETIVATCSKWCIRRQHIV